MVQQGCTYRNYLIFVHILIAVFMSYSITANYWQCTGVEKGHGQVSLPVAAGLGWQEEIELRGNCKSKQTIRANLITSQN